MFIVIIILLACAAAAGVFFGSVPLGAGDVLGALCGSAAAGDSVRYIVLECRVPAVVASVLSGAALGVSGLLLQTCFRNPLAGPSILGVTSGASLGVALATLLPAAGAMGVLTPVAAGAGAAGVIAVLLALSAAVGGKLMLLIAGIMVSYLAGALTSLLCAMAQADAMQGYVMWGMGAFNVVSPADLPLFGVLVVVGLALAAALVRRLNLLLLGERYAETLGVPIRSTRVLLLAAVGVLTAAATAYCGPIAFLGLATPHIARLALGTCDHRRLLPATAVLGAALACVCNVVVNTAADGAALPVNAITPLFGAPVVLYIILRKG